MDRLSAVLVVCIIILIGTNAVIVYNVWIKGSGDEAVEIYSYEAIEKGDFAFNNDTSIECISDKDLWIRAKLVYSGEYDNAEYEIISEAIDEGYWKKCNDGWYYCTENITFGESTRPLIDELIHEGKKVRPEEPAKFRMQVEAVDEAWFDDVPLSCTHAFRMLEELYSEQDIKELL